MILPIRSQGWGISSGTCLHCTFILFSWLGYPTVGGTALPNIRVLTCQLGCKVSLLSRMSIPGRSWDLKLYLTPPQNEVLLQMASHTGAGVSLVGVNPRGTCHTHLSYAQVLPGRWFESKFIVANYRRQPN